MKKVGIILMVALLGVLLTGCQYDDSDLWNEVEKIKDRVKMLEESVIQTNNDIVALQTIVDALQKNVYVTSVKTNEKGYTITFSDGKTANITNGKDGVNGTNAPVISVKQDSDGNYYWTIDGEWLLVDGHKVRANGLDGANGENGTNGENGANGKDAVAPQVRINKDSKEWEISTDGGQTWVSTGVVAEGKDGANGTNGSNGSNGTNGENGDTFFKSVDTSHPDYVIITLVDGTEFRLARYDETCPLFVIVEAPELAQIEYGQLMEFVVDAKNIADYVVNVPQGWKASYAESVLEVTAPEKDLCHFDKEGVIAITVVSQEGKSAIVKLNVKTGEWVDEIVFRTLNFEDADAKFEPFTLTGYNAETNEYYDHEVNTWSDLIDNPQYGGPLTYGDQMAAMYWWWDEGNTELMHIFPENWGSYCFWGGGHAISNYWGAGFSDEDRDKHIAKYYGEDYVAENAGNDAMLGWFNLQFMIPVPAHSGDNFVVHYGYKDFFSYTDNLPELAFADGQARVIDHMYVTNTNYTLNQLVNGVQSEAGNTFGGSWEGLHEDAWLKIVAYGFENSDDEEHTSEVEFDLVQGENVVTDWQKWDLTSLGKVSKVQFNFLFSEDMGGRYGFTIPGYFAYDDVTVQFGSKKVFK